MSVTGRKPRRDDPAELPRFFTLLPEDLVAIAAVRGDAHRLHLALLLAWARTERTLIADPATLPDEVIAFVALQLGIAPAVLTEDAVASATRAADAELVRRHLGVRSFRPDDIGRMTAFLKAKATLTGNTAALRDAAIDWLAREGVLRPGGNTTIDRLIYQARSDTEEAQYAYLTDQLEPAEREVLDGLCRTDRGNSPLAGLVAPAKQASATAIRAECRRLQDARATLPADVDWADIAPNLRRQWANVVRKLSAQALRRYSPAKRHAMLLAFLDIRIEELADSVVDMFDVLIGRVFTRSDHDLTEFKAEQAQSYADSARLFRTIAEVLRDPQIPQEAVRDEVFRRVPRERLGELIELTGNLSGSHVRALFDILDDRYSHIREFVPVVLETLQFRSPGSDGDLLAALKALQDSHTSRGKRLPDDTPVDFIPQRWRKAVVLPDGVDRRAWTFALLSEARGALRAGDLTIDGSRRYTPWDRDLYDRGAWDARRKTWFEERGLPEDGATYMQDAIEVLHAETLAVLDRLPRNAAARVENEKLVLTALEKVVVPVAAQEARRRLGALLPRVSLPQLLMEVDSWTGFGRDLYHLAARREAGFTQGAGATLFAVLIAEATNIGLSAMATASGIPYGQLVRIHDWHFREDTIRQAIGRLIAYHGRIPLTAAFGDGTTSSSDGIRFGVASSALNARHLPRYFGMRRGITLYTHVSDQGTQFWVDVVNCQFRDATYVLDGLLYQDELPLHEHYTDTAGYTDLVFGLFELLGFRFAPRLRDLPDQALYRARKGHDYGVLAPALRKNIRVDLIVRHWDDLNRLAASLKDGLVRPSMIVAKLQSMRRQNSLQQAIQELGRIAKTRHVLAYVDDEELRRRVLVGLNKGESQNAMARSIFFGRQGRFADGDYEGQLNRASALGLVMNAIVVWNTRYLEAAAELLARRGEPVPEDAWRYLSPVQWGHVHLVGNYRFDDVAIPDGLRPLGDA